LLSRCQDSAATKKHLSKYYNFDMGSEVFYTMGHSTLAIEDFIRTLKAYEIEQVIDVRTIPKSRHNPQYNTDDLREALQGQGIAYQHMPGLGGLRHTTKDSINLAWKNTSFRGFADYMQTPEFGAALDELIALGKEKRCVILCAEAVPWRCHRSLIGDALVVRGIGVTDILNAKSSKPHMLTAWAKVEGTKVTYPPGPLP
jgi:uncharacterized protein (DUF488 family)